MPISDWIFLIAGSTLASLAVFFLVFWFNRDPERHVPAPAGRSISIVSPSDGRVLYVRQFQPESLPTPRKFNTDVYLSELDKIAAFPNGGFLIGIYLSPFDVHVTRAPISGRVTLSEHQEGHFFSKALFDLKTRDERSTCIIEGNALTVGVVQMAAYAVRRVILTIKAGSEVQVGQRIGKIKMGSQVDLILSHDERLRILVKPGDKVRAGETVVTVLDKAENTGENQPHNDKTAIQ